MRRMLAAMVVLGGALAVASSAAAHPLSPALLELRELGGREVQITWRRSLLKVPGSDDLSPVLPDGCTPTGPQRETEDDEALTTTWSVACSKEGLVGARVGIEGLDQAFTDALIRVVFADGKTLRAVISNREPFLVIPARESRATVFKGYMNLGIRHILSGLDHLIFIFGLFLLVASRRALLATITSFTVGHSVTLSLVALGFARVPPAPVEVLIAFSIYVLAVDLVRDREANDTLLRRRPWLMALLFGLLHGMGFAGALREVGLPADEIPLSLFSFNAGIEVGQVAFVLAVSASAGVLRARLDALPAWTARVPVYAMGSLAVFWMVERSSLF